MLCQDQLTEGTWALDLTLSLLLGDVHMFVCPDLQKTVLAKEPQNLRWRWVKIPVVGMGLMATSSSRHSREIRNEEKGFDCRSALCGPALVAKPDLYYG